MAYIEYLLCLPAFNISICVASCLHLCAALNAVLQKEFAPAQQIKWFSSCLSFAPLNYLHANESPAEALPKQSLKTASWGAEQGHFHLLPPVLPSSMIRSTSTLPKAEVGTFSFFCFFFLSWQGMLNPLGRLLWVPAASLVSVRCGNGIAAYSAPNPQLPGSCFST